MKLLYFISFFSNYSLGTVYISANGISKKGEDVLDVAIVDPKGALSNFQLTVNKN